MSAGSKKAPLDPTTRYARRSATYFRAQEAGKAGEVNYTLCLYTGGKLDETMLVPSNMLPFELNALRKQGYEVTRSDG